jgi:hypothetical protein
MGQTTCRLWGKRSSIINWWALRCYGPLQKGLGADWNAELHEAWISCYNKLSGRDDQCFTERTHLITGSFDFCYTSFKLLPFYVFNFCYIADSIYFSGCDLLCAACFSSFNLLGIVAQQTDIIFHQHQGK